MKRNSLSFLTLWILASVYTSASFALDEMFEDLAVPQSLAMGNAFSTENQGYQSHFYNPASLSKLPERKYEVVIGDLQGIGGIDGWARVLNEQALGFGQILKSIQSYPGGYHYYRLNALSGFTMRGLGVALLGSYQMAGESDGTLADVNALGDVGSVVGLSTSLAGNLVKVGISGKFLIRTQLKGNYTHAQLSSPEEVTSRMTEGFGVGANIGLLATLPYKFLPRLAVVWKDVMDTHFLTGTHILNSRASGKPEDIEQSVNVGVSVQPQLNRATRATIAAEFKHIERGDLPLRKKLHFGVQLVSERKLFIWAGMNQLYPTAGIGMRLPGGSFEIGTYAQDVGRGDIARADRRFFFRYTVSFEP